KAANEKRKNLKREGSSFPICFDSDSLAEVFGPDKGNGNLCGLSSCLSKKRVMQARLTAAVLENTSSNCNTSVKGVKRDSLSPNIGLNSVDDTSTMNLDSTFEGQRDDNFGHMESASQKVNILSKQGNIVATGYVLTGKEGEVCHHRIVQADERKVFIEPS
ncbi:hypothetical protein MKX01_013933, partial [Papaver californicum]